MPDATASRVRLDVSAVSARLGPGVLTPASHAVGVGARSILTYRISALPLAVTGGEPELGVSSGGRGICRARPRIFSEYTMLKRLPNRHRRLGLEWPGFPLVGALAPRRFGAHSSAHEDQPRVALGWLRAMSGVHGVGQRVVLVGSGCCGGCLCGGGGSVDGSLG